MSYYRIRKDWNDGKWDKTQKGAFTSYESALNNFTDEDKENDYKIFSPEGEILYPYHEITQMMINDGVELDIFYWDSIFKNNLPIDNDSIKNILCKYSNLVNQLKSDNVNDEITTNEIEITYFNEELKIYKIPVNRFKIRIVDEYKKNLNYSSYFNGGYFAKYKEEENNMMKIFTLPVANIVADYSFDELPTVSHKYLKERKYTDEKIYFGANDNGPQFRGKNVSTLIIYDNDKADIKRVNDIKVDNIKYAISGYPIILDYNNISMTDALDEGWDTSVTRNTYHNFIGIKDDNFIYCFYYETNKSGSSMSKEVYDLIRDFGFKSLIKLDGGGSAFFKYDDCVEMATTENRQINSICIIE